MKKPQCPKEQPGRDTAAKAQMSSLSFLKRRSNRSSAPGLGPQKSCRMLTKLTHSSSECPIGGKADTTWSQSIRCFADLPPCTLGDALQAPLENPHAPQQTKGTKGHSQVLPKPLALPHAQSHSKLLVREQSPHGFLPQPPIQHHTARKTKL